jgi:N-alpha-acetyltransferase 35, NatC auxiliary subunit
MAWHSGNTLSQTVFTCLYVHNLEEIDPECFPYELILQEDPSRPWALVTFVLRAGVAAFLKCIDMAWRELSKGRVLDVSIFAHSMTSSSVLL